MNQSVATRLSTVLLAALCMGGCSGGPKVAKVYEDKAFRGPLQKILVVAIHDDRNMRARFERLLANTIVERGGSARAITSEIGTDKVLDESLVASVAKDIGADGILVISVKSSESSLELKKGRSEFRKDRKSDGLADFFRYDYTEIADPDEVKLTRTVILTSDLYLLDDGKKVWSIESTSFKRDNVEQVLNDEAGAIAGRLDRDRLIP